MRLAWLLLVGTMPVVAAGCGGSSSSGKPTPRTTAARDRATAPAASVVDVTEREWSLALRGSTMGAGAVVLHVRNAGRLRHALAIDGPGVQARTGPIAPGGSATLRVTLAKGGSYTVYCPIDGHRGRGMETQLATAGTAAGVPPATTPSMMGGGYGGGGY
jgi:plastocyanin